WSCCGSGTSSSEKMYRRLSKAAEASLMKRSVVSKRLDYEVSAALDKRYIARRVFIVYGRRSLRYEWSQNRSMGSIIRLPNYIANFLPSRHAVKESYALAIQLKRLFFYDSQSERAI